MNNANAPPHNVSNGDYRRFYEHGEYLLKIHSDHKNLTIVAIKEDRLAYTAPAWGTFTTLIALQIIYIFGRFPRLKDSQLIFREIQYEKV